MPIHEFHHLQSHVNRLYSLQMGCIVNRQNTTSLRWSKSCLSPIFNTVKVQVVRNYTNFITCKRTCSLTNYYMCSKHDLRQPMLKDYSVRPKDYRWYIWFRNMNCANWRNSCIVTRTNVYYSRKWSQIMTWANLIRSFLTLDMKLYCVDKWL